MAVESFSPPVEADQVASACRALGHPTRLRLFSRLAPHDALSGQQLASLINENDPRAVSYLGYHIRELEQAGLIEHSRTGPSGREYGYRLTQIGRLAHSALHSINAVAVT
jgi:DNA-binding transcriptional ArsR family regulator